MPETKIRTRPTTASPAIIGLKGDHAQQAESIYQAVRLVAAGHEPAEVSAATGLDVNFIGDLMEKFW